MQGPATLAEEAGTSWEIRPLAISSLRQLLLLDPFVILSEGWVRLPESERRDRTPFPTTQTSLGGCPWRGHSLGHWSTLEQ